MSQQEVTSLSMSQQHCSGVVPKGGETRRTRREAVVGMSHCQSACHGSVSQARAVTALTEVTHTAPQPQRGEEGT